MRNIVLLMHTSLDGFVAGPDGEMDWINHDNEIFSYVTEHFKNVDTAIYGRVTYGMMESYWPTVTTNPKSSEAEVHHAKWYDNINKIVFSKTLQNTTSKNTKIFKEITPATIKSLKAEPGKNIMIFGSPRVTHSMLQQSLIDELIININPIILGQGIPLFKNSQEKVSLKTLSSKVFQNGVLGVHYKNT